jgi:hypothetical protein
VLKVRYIGGGGWSSESLFGSIGYRLRVFENRVLRGILHEIIGDCGKLNNGYPSPDIGMNT